MHVLILPSWYPTPDNPINGVFFKEQAHALSKVGLKVGVVHVRLMSVRGIFKALKAPLGMRRENDGDIPTFWFNGFRMPRLRSYNLARYVRLGRALYLRYIGEHGVPDVIHAHSMLNAGFLAECLGGEYGVPYVITEHSSMYARGKVRESQRTALLRVVERASRLMAVSNEFARLLGALFPEAGKTWEFLPNLVSGPFWEYPLPGKRRGAGYRFICIALLTPKKGVDILIRAFAEHFRNVDGVELRIGGDGPERESLRRLAGEIGVADKVTFLGLLARDRVLREMADSDALVVSSLYETFGVVLVEALALGRPVLATKCGGPESIVETGDGYLVEKGSVPALAEGLGEIYRNRTGFDPEDIRSRCKRRFGEEAVVSRLVRIYDSVLSDNG